MMKKRKAPPYPSVPCAGEIKEGNDENMWESVAKGKSYRWVPKSTESHRKKSANNQK